MFENFTHTNTPCDADKLRNRQNVSPPINIHFRRRRDFDSRYVFYFVGNQKKETVTVWMSSEGEYDSSRKGSSASLTARVDDVCIIRPRHQAQRENHRDGLDRRDEEPATELPRSENCVRRGVRRAGGRAPAIVCCVRGRHLVVAENSGINNAVTATKKRHCP